jgi:hypothetical protein
VPDAENEKREGAFDEKSPPVVGGLEKRLPPNMLFDVVPPEELVPNSDPPAE